MGGLYCLFSGAVDVFYVVDVSGYVFRAYHALPPLSNSKGEPTHAVLGTITMLEKILESRRPSWFAVALDSPGPTFREGLDARYKATRPPPPADFSGQMARVEQILRAWGVACFRQDGLEADDLIATATLRALGAGLRVVVVSADKDLLQLAHDGDDRVLVGDFMCDRVSGPREVLARFGILPSRLGDELALTGDASDNVPGVAGVGPKTATELLTKFGSFDGIVRVARQGRQTEAAREPVVSMARKRGSRESWSRSTPRRTSNGTSPSCDGRDFEGIVELRGLYSELELRRQLTALGATATATATPTATATATATPTATPTATSTSISTPTPTPVCIFDATALAALVERARARSRIGLAVERTHSARIGATIVGIAMALAPDDVAYLPIPPSPWLPSAPSLGGCAAALGFRSCGTRAWRNSLTT